MLISAMAGFVKSKLLLISTLSLAFPMLVACNTLRGRHFDEVHVGMEKDQILNLVGGPDASFRWQGKDRWVYRFKDENATTVKEVHFADGKAVYVGEPPKPEVTAEMQDKQNDEKNKAAEAKEKSEIKARKNEVDTGLDEVPSFNIKKIAPTFESL